jgi:cyclopropane fatty-acyl-phospholipid synthase-like methyltransferase
MMPRAAACERNRRPILAVLQKELQGRHTLLEIGSGTGEHAVYVGARLPAVTWQTSDLEESHAGINQWRDWSGLDNVLPPLLLDTTESPDIDPGTYTAIFSSNTAHIMGMQGVKGMFALAGKVLKSSGVFILYGPFRQQGRFTGPSDEVFHTSLQGRDPLMGIRDLEVLDELANAANMKRNALYAMPANNWIVIWKKENP